jgi:hypothetical protein
MDNGQGKYKVRFFDWRDLFLVQRLQRHGQVLDYKRAQVDGVFPLRDALHTYLPLSAGRHHTLVMSGNNAFAQYVYHRKSNWVRLTYLAPTPARAQDAELWVDLLEQLTMVVGEQGIHHIVAEARHDGPELELLQRIGFGVFARQVLLRRASPLVQDADLSPLTGLRPWRSTDDWGARLLHASVVPKLVQQIEAPVEDAFNPSYWSNRLVLIHDGEVVACVVTRRGRVGSAMRLLVHPQADAQVDTLIRHGLATLGNAPQQPVYCRVRRYEGWLQAPLEASGFEPGPSTVLLVKHTVARVLTPAWNRLPLVEGQTEMTTPIVSNYQRLDKQTGVD